MNRIFANTFGNLLAPKINIEAARDKAIYFYNDPNILLQEIDVDILFDKDQLSNELSKLLNTSIILNDDEYSKIIQQYYMKQNVGYFIWLSLTGIIASLISVNTILLQDCIIE